MAPFGSLKHLWNRLLCPYCACAPETPTSAQHSDRWLSSFPRHGLSSRSLSASAICISLTSGTLHLSNAAPRLLLDLCFSWEQEGHSRTETFAPVLGLVLAALLYGELHLRPVHQTFSSGSQRAYGSLQQRPRRSGEIHVQRLPPAAPLPYQRQWTRVSDPARPGMSLVALCRSHLASTCSREALGRRCPAGPARGSVRLLRPVIAPPTPR
jgi:hypothetical protein